MHANKTIPIEKTYKRITRQDKCKTKGNTGSDKKSAHPLLINTSKQGHCTVIFLGGTKQYIKAILNQHLQVLVHVSQ